MFLFNAVMISYYLTISVRTISWYLLYDINQNQMKMFSYDTLISAYLDTRRHNPWSGQVQQARNLEPGDQQLGGNLLMRSKRMQNEDGQGTHSKHSNLNWMRKNWGKVRGPFKKLFSMKALDPRFLCQTFCCSVYSIILIIIIIQAW